MNEPAGARKLLRQCQSAALATHSRHLQGYPYASLVPLVLDHDANPILLISRLAEHTKNVEADERVSIVAHAPGTDIQSASRLTLLGSCRRTDERADLAARYLRYFPSAASLLQLDFDFYRITPAAVRYIGGFGSVHWLAADAIKPPPNELRENELTLLEYANTSLEQDLRGWLHREHAITPHAVSMIGLDCDGVDVRTDDARLRFEFAKTVCDADSARAALIALFSAGKR